MKKSRMKKAGIVMGMVLAAVLLAGFAYVNDYYRSDERAEVCLVGTETVAVTQIEEGIFLDGGGTEGAIIFYPGAKVEYTAYLPMLMLLAEEGTDCFLVKMPCNLAFFGVNKAQKIMEEYAYDRWYLAGHSLGGAMAASYASSHLEELNGLALFAAYPTSDLSGEHFSVISVYGSEDRVLNMEKVVAGRQWMPNDYTEVCIEGGNHAQFGSYGNQEGDGQAEISPEEQWQQAVETVLEMTGKKIGQ